MTITRKTAMDQVKAVREAVQDVATPAAVPAKVGNYRWVVLGLIFVIWAIACADRANLGVALPYMKAEYAISNTEAGMIISLFSFAYGIVQIPAGLIYKRLSNKVTGALFPI